VKQKYSTSKGSGFLQLIILVAEFTICLGLLAGYPYAAARGYSVEVEEADKNAISDTEELKNLVVLYARSIDNADAESASELWSTTEPVSFIHPRGHECGFEQVLKNFYGKTIWDRFSQRKLTIKDVSIHVIGTAAWAEFYWEFEAKHKVDGLPLKSQGRETQIFCKDVGSGWRLVHVHYSSMPVSGFRQGF
jgi:ketosteroid isomerase-like protein